MQPFRMPASNKRQKNLSKLHEKGCTYLHSAGVGSLGSCPAFLVTFLGYLLSSRNKYVPHIANNKRGSMADMGRL